MFKRNYASVLGVLGLGTTLLLGCSDRPRTGSPHAAHELARGPVAPPTYETRQQSSMLTLEPTPEVTPPAAGPTSVDARLLVITAEGTDPAYLAIADSLRHLGTPFDVFNASTEPPLTADRLANGDHGLYYGVVLDLGNLASGSASAFSDAEWTVLASYEAQFSVRRAALYTFPEPAYGMSTSGGLDTGATPLRVTCSDAGSEVFADLNCAAGLTIKQAWAYPALATDAATQPLLVDGSGRILAAIRQQGDNRETLALTFAQSPSLVHTLALLPDVVRWVTRGVHVGERHVMADSQIDDLFLATVTYQGDPNGYRLSPGDMQALSDWQLRVQAGAATPTFRVDWALNGQGSDEIPGDPLAARAQALGASFRWISHTWDHAYLDETPPADEGDLWAGSYAAAMDEFTRNNNLVARLGLQPYDVRNIVTPGVSGLTNPEAMRAAHDAGIRFLVGDTSVAGYDNPSPKTGLWSPLQPELLIIPRRPTNLFYNVSTPAEWEDEYNLLYREFWGRDLTAAEIMEFESELLLHYLLRGESDPWMFHQANARDVGDGRSLISELHDLTFAKYAALSRLPIVNPTMDQLGTQLKARMQFDEAGVTATIGPGATITIRAKLAATVPVSGLCTPAAETYGGRRISYIPLGAGEEATFSLVGCNEGNGGGAIDGGAAGDVDGGASGDAGVGNAGGIPASCASASGTGD